MKTICVLLGIFASIATNLFAGEESQNVNANAAVPGPFDRGTWELEAGAGEFCSFSTTSASRPTINYQLDVFRIGWMYDSPRFSGWLRGNNEFMLEVDGGPVTFGGGNYLAGGALLWRYNFIQPDSKWVPYFQIGAGALGNDMYKDRAQKEVGEAFEFGLQADAGLRYMINDQWSVSAEFGYRHISDANLSTNNEGLNSLGGLMMVSYRFH